MIFETAQDAFASLHCMILTEGRLLKPRGELVREAQNCSFEVRMPERRMIHCPEREFSFRVAMAEFLWYMSGNRSVESISRYIPRWRDFANSDGTAESNYGATWKEQIPRIVEVLSLDQDSRRAVVSIYDGKRHLPQQAGARDVPCTETMQFMVRDGRLDLIVNMRSNDLWWGFCLDQFSFTILQELVANDLRLPVGRYFHNAGSMHVYERHFHVRVAQPQVLPPRQTCGYTFTNFWDQFEADLAAREQNFITRSVLGGTIDVSVFTKAREEAR